MADVTSLTPSSLGARNILFAPKMCFQPYTSKRPEHIKIKLYRCTELLKNTILMYGKTFQSKNLDSGKFIDLVNRGENCVRSTSIFVRISSKRSHFSEFIYNIILSDLTDAY